jgi:UDP-glucose 4-epimerase
LKFNAFRYFNAAGASERLGEHHRHESHLIPIIIQVTLGQRKVLQVFGNDYPTKDGTCVRDYIHVIDLAQAHILALDNLDRHPNGKYNLGNGHGFSVLEVIETAGKITDVHIQYQFAPRRPGDPAVLVASSEHAQQELGWKPKYNDLETIFSTVWGWHKKHPCGYSD